MSDLAGLSDEELTSLHAAVHEEIRKRDVNAVLKDVNAPRPVPEIYSYKMRAWDAGAKKYVFWESMEDSLKDAKGVGPFEDPTVLGQVRVR